MKKTNEQFETAIAQCRDVFDKKMKDYGTAWRILRPSSMTDQIFIRFEPVREVAGPVGFDAVRDQTVARWLGHDHENLFGVLVENVAHLEIPLLALGQKSAPYLKL